MTMMRKARIGFAALLLLAGGLSLAPPQSVAQESPNGRDCQTITTCNFRKGGTYRGCLSSYSCRVCRFVPGRCAAGSSRKRCYSSVCTWG